MGPPSGEGCQNDDKEQPPAQPAASSSGNGPEEGGQHRRSQRKRGRDDRVVVVVERGGGGGSRRLDRQVTKVSSSSTSQSRTTAAKEALGHKSKSAVVVAADLEPVGRPEFRAEQPHIPLRPVKEVVGEYLKHVKRVRAARKEASGAAALPVDQGEPATTHNEAAESKPVVVQTGGGEEKSEPEISAGYDEGLPEESGGIRESAPLPPSTTLPHGPDKEDDSGQGGGGGSIASSSSTAISSKAGEDDLGMPDPEANDDTDGYRVGDDDEEDDEEDDHMPLDVVDEVCEAYETPLEPSPYPPSASTYKCRQEDEAFDYLLSTVGASRTSRGHDVSGPKGLAENIPKTMGARFVATVSDDDSSGDGDHEEYDEESGSSLLAHLAISDNIDPVLRCEETLVSSASEAEEVGEEDKDRRVKPFVASKRAAAANTIIIVGASSSNPARQVRETGGRRRRQNISADGDAVKADEALDGGFVEGGPAPEVKDVKMEEHLADDASNSTSTDAGGNRKKIKRRRGFRLSTNRNKSKKFAVVHSFDCLGNASAAADAAAVPIPPAASADQSNSSSSESATEVSTSRRRRKVETRPVDALRETGDDGSETPSSGKKTCKPETTAPEADDRSQEKSSSKSKTTSIVKEEDGMMLERCLYDDCSRRFYSFFSMMRHVAFFHHPDETAKLMKLKRRTAVSQHQQRRRRRQRLDRHSKT